MSNCIKRDEIDNFKTIMQVEIGRNIDVKMISINGKDEINNLYSLKEGYPGFVSFEDVRIWSLTGFSDDVEIEFYFYTNQKYIGFAVIPIKDLKFGC